MDSILICHGAIWEATPVDEVTGIAGRFFEKKRLSLCHQIPIGVVAFDDVPVITLGKQRILHFL